MQDLLGKYRLTFKPPVEVSQDRKSLRDFFMPIQNGIAQQARGFFILRKNYYGKI